MLKKIFLVLSIAVFLTPLLKAQDLHFGIQMSPTWSWLRSDYSKINGSGNALGLKLSAIVENRFSQAYSVSSGIGFHFNSGGRLRFDVPSNFWVESKDEFSPTPAFRADSASFPGDAQFRYNLTYVEVPIGLKMRTAESGGHMRYFAEPGIVLGFRSTSKGSINSAGSLDQEKINIKKDIIGINLSWGIGGGVEYVISNNTALVGGLYYQRGFTDITDDSGTTFDADGKSGARKENSKTILQSITLRLGVMF